MLMMDFTANKKWYKLPAKKLRILKVGIIYLYGSVANANALKFSDIDIGVVFTKPEVLYNSHAAYSRLYDIFERGVKPKREIDLVFLQRTSPGLQFNVINEGKVLYEISSEFRNRYEEKVLNEYLDFRKVIDHFNKVAVEAFK